jgi:hypothetical protein
MRRPVAVAAVVGLLVLGLAGEAAACVCANEPIQERLDEADAAVVGRVVDRRETTLRGSPLTLLTVEVDQRVKGDVPRELVVRSPRGTDCDLVVPEAPEGDGGATGLLLASASDGTWLGSLCSIVDPGTLVAEGGEPRGGPIKVVIGLAVLGLVLLWAFRRLRRGARPQLPGPPPA